MKISALVLSLLLSSTSYAATDCIEGNSISYKQIQEISDKLSTCSTPVLRAAENVLQKLLRSWKEEQGDAVGLRSLPVLVAIAGAKADLALVRLEMYKKEQKKAARAAEPKADEPSDNAE